MSLLHIHPSAVPFVNPAIQCESLRAIFAQFLAALRGCEDDEDSAAVFDDLAARHGDESGAALTRAGHRVRLLDEP